MYRIGSIYNSTKANADATTAVAAATAAAATAAAAGFTIELCAGLVDKAKSLPQIVVEEIHEEVSGSARDAL
jgi:hypothetical protein